MFILMGKGGAIYILTNYNKTVLYIGVTSDLVMRLIEHRDKVYPNSFSSRYNTCICIYYEIFSSIEEAIDREKQIKKWSRKKKEYLINTVNPKWDDLWQHLKEW